MKATRFARLKSWITLMAAGFALTACSTFSKRECSQMDWNARGYTSALEGQTLGSSFDYFARECGGRHGISPDRAAFEVGFDAGLRSLCTRSGAIIFGRNGGRYAGTCPREAEDEFLQGYQLGRVEYMGDRIELLEREVRDLRYENARRRSRILELEAELRRR